MDEAFEDHWGHIPGDFNFWTQRVFGKEDFDPSLCFLVVAGNQIAASALCFFKQEKGWVQTLGVRKPWRRLGLGLALLNHALGEFYRRGKRVVELGVDAQNPTGATRLYQRAGMHVANEYVVYEKELRPGI
jgi:ribosomal protein S18 acetylase RimI-like enzyme